MSVSQGVQLVSFKKKKRRKREVLVNIPDESHTLFFFFEKEFRKSWRGCFFSRCTFRMPLGIIIKVKGLKTKFPVVGYRVGSRVVVSVVVEGEAETLGCGGREDQQSLQFNFLSALPNSAS